LLLNQIDIGGILWYLVKGSDPVRYNGGGDKDYGEKINKALENMGIK